VRVSLYTLAILSAFAAGCESLPRSEAVLACPAGTKEVVTHDAEIVRHRCQDSAGIGNGPAWTLDREGTLTSYGVVRNDLPEGRWLALEHDRRLWAEIEFQGGEARRMRTWYENGTLQEDWRHRTPEDADIRRWHENGNLSDELTYRDGETEGRWMQWWPSGFPRRQWHWHRGQLEGEYTFWSESGALKIRGQYSAGEKVGVWEHYTEAGELERREEYHAGQPASRD
jgi:antitoxin component YwqK of YwqJK toxin-antitoxin module